METAPKSRAFGLLLAIMLASLLCGWDTTAAGQGKGKKGGGKKKAKAAAKRQGAKPDKPPAAKPPVEHAIRAGEPTRSPSGLPDNQDKGRIIGGLKRCPGCTIELMGADGAAAQKLAVKHGEPEYQLGWTTPGTYALCVSAGGRQLFVPNVTVEAGHYTRVDIEFVAEESTATGSQDAPPEKWPTWKPEPEPKVPVPDFKPKSFKELEKPWGGGDRTISGDDKNKKRRGKGRKKHKNNDKGVPILGT